MSFAAICIENAIMNEQNAQNIVTPTETFNSLKDFGKCFFFFSFVNRKILLKFAKL